MNPWAELEPPYSTIVADPPWSYRRSGVQGAVDDQYSTLSEQVGLGWYFRVDTEHCLFATRGSAPIPGPLRESNVLWAARAAHSAKPQAFVDLVERVSPGPYVELFARTPRLGWDSWGRGFEGAA